MFFMCIMLQVLLQHPQKRLLKVIVIERLPRSGTLQWSEDASLQGNDVPHAHLQHEAHAPHGPAPGAQR